jgi:hypothetical protein
VYILFLLLDMLLICYWYLDSLFWFDCRMFVVALSVG